MKIFRRIITIIGIILGIIILGVGIYLIVVVSTYYRIGDTDLEVSSNAINDEVKLNETYKISTYNLGFGAYSQDFTFFLDTGYDESGNKTCGYSSKAFNKDDVIFNTNGAINTIKELDVDFALFQEVDIASTRSYYVNQYEEISKALNSYDSVFVTNFHTVYLPYPIYDMHGKVLGGLSTFSKYKITSSKRKEYTVSTNLSKLFDLDRCFNINTITVENGKTLYIVNSHMSAYDEGGMIREKQISELNSFLEACKSTGDYVIVGGDFNHDLLTFNPDYSYTLNSEPFNNISKKPDWVSFMFDENGNIPFTEGYKVVAANNYPTCRNNDITWQPGKTYVCAVDGYIVSSNITVEKITNIRTKNGKLQLDGFAYSDHEPVYLEFKLN